MLSTVVLVCLVALGETAVALVLFGHRIRNASRAVTVVGAALVSVVSGEVAARGWQLPTRDILVGEVALLAATCLVTARTPQWNPVGRAFFATTVASCVAYLALDGWATVAGGLSWAGVVASGLVWALEVVALVIACSFAFESCDTLCRVSWSRSELRPDPTYLPKVSLHVPAYAEPPEMLIETIGALERLDYPDYEIIVIDNNTTDEALWKPVEEYCQGRDRIRFVHVAPWPGYKSGALNLALNRHTADDAEVIGVVDADYLVEPGYLRALTGHFADPRLAFVQTPQDYRDWQGDRYLTACHDAYRYFFETAMPSRNERNSIIFGGTMGLIRRAALEDIGGWDEWCITEDAEASLRLLRAGWSGLYVNHSYGHGIMPLSFAALKRQMFRWCFGGVQILKKHHRSLMPWDRSPDNRLGTAQRLDYLLGGLQWFGNLAGLGFTILLAASALMLDAFGRAPLRPLVGATVLLPVTILGTGLLRAVWALRHRCRLSRRRALLAFVNWLSLSWTIAVACIQGLLRPEGVFLRTPKSRGGTRLGEAFRVTRTETALAGAAALGAVVTAAFGRAALLVVGLLVWQGTVYAAAPTMAWLNQRSELSARLERIRRNEERRARLVQYRPHLAVSGLVASAAVAGIVLFTGPLESAHAGSHFFSLPQRSSSDAGPLGDLGVLPGLQPSGPARTNGPAHPVVRAATPTTSTSSPLRVPASTVASTASTVAVNRGAVAASGTTLPSHAPTPAGGSGGVSAATTTIPTASGGSPSTTTSTTPTTSTTRVTGPPSTVGSTTSTTVSRTPTTSGRPTSTTSTTNPHRP